MNDQITKEDEEPSHVTEGYKEKVMAQFTAAEVEKHAKKIMDAFEDGFEWSDIITVIPQVMEIVGEVQDMTNEEKQTSAEAILDYVIDEHDLPWIPDGLVDPLLKKGVRYIIPLLFKAAQGNFNFGS